MLVHELDEPEDARGQATLGVSEGTRDLQVTIGPSDGAVHILPGILELRRMIGRELRMRVFERDNDPEHILPNLRSTEQGEELPLAA